MNRLKNRTNIFNFIDTLNKSKNRLNDNYRLLEQINIIFNFDFLYISNTTLNAKGSYDISNADYTFGDNDLVNKLRANIRKNNDGIFSYAQKINIPFVINKSTLVREGNNETMKILRLSDLNSGIAYHYKSPCNKGTYISIGFKKSRFKEINIDLFLLYMLAPHISNFMYYQSNIKYFNETSPLTSREKQVFTLFKKGMKPNSISKNLFISERTIRFHLDNIVLKLNANNKIHALSIADKLNII